MYDLSELNPTQREAVELTEGPLLLLAGAGSGKTRVLTYRIAHMIHEGADPRSILAITFTNKAAAEMRDRIVSLAGSESRGLWVGTFHAVCIRILRRDIENLPGYQRGFVIFDTADQLATLRGVMTELNIDDKKFAPRSLLEVISNAKNRLLTADDFARQANDFFEKIAARVYTAYQAKLTGNNALDFDDIIMMTVRLFREYPQILASYQNRFRSVLVDEYQDTNHAQYVLINLLASLYRNLCVVGDDDQSVYGWRGADIRNILDFERDYPEAAVLKLEQNYRSSGSILAVANAVVRHNRGRKDKALWTDRGDGDAVTVCRTANDVEEAQYAVGEIQRLRDERGLNYGDFALLYRTNAQSRVLEERFIRAGVPYRVYSGVKFYERMEIKDTLAYLRFVYNPADSVSFRRIVNMPRRGIGDTSVQKLMAYAEDESIPVMALLLSLQALGQEIDLQTRAVNALYNFALLIQSFREAAASGASVSELTQMILTESGYWESLKANRAAENEARLENLEEFLNLTAEFDEQAARGEDDDGDGFDEDDERADVSDGMALLGVFLERVALVADIDTYEDGEDVVKFMTIHSAKGLEFPVVFITGMEEGVFPSHRSLLEADMLEEERRLCYVAVTRAREVLYLLHARQRTRFGRTESAVPSRFLSEVPSDWTQEVDESDWGMGYGHGRIRRSDPGRSGQQERGYEAGAGKREVRAGSGARTRTGAGNQTENQAGGEHRAARPSEGTDAFLVGDRVVHPTFGQGLVMSCRDVGGESEVTVVFAGEIKKLLASYARLEKVEK